MPKVHCLKTAADRFPAFASQQLYSPPMASVLVDMIQQSHARFHLGCCSDQVIVWGPLFQSLCMHAGGGSTDIFVMERSDLLIAVHVVCCEIGPEFYVYVLLRLDCF